MPPLHRIRLETFGQQGLVQAVTVGLLGRGDVRVAEVGARVEEIEWRAHVQCLARPAAAVEQGHIHRVAAAVAGGGRDVAVEQIRLGNVRMPGLLQCRIHRGMGPGHKGLHRTYRAVAVQHLQAIALGLHRLLGPGQRAGSRIFQVAHRGQVARYRRTGEVVAAHIAHVQRDIRRQRGHIHHAGRLRAALPGLVTAGLCGTGQHQGGQQGKATCHGLFDHCHHCSCLKEAPPLGAGARVTQWKSYCRASSQERPRGSAIRVSHAAPAA